MGRNVDGARNGLGCVPDRIYRGVSDWEDGVMEDMEDQAVAWRYRDLCDNTTSGSGDWLLADTKPSSSHRQVEPLYARPLTETNEKLRTAKEALECIDAAKSITPVWIQRRVRAALSALQEQPQ